MIKWIRAVFLLLLSMNSMALADDVRVSALNAVDSIAGRLGIGDFALGRGLSTVSDMAQRGQQITSTVDAIRNNPGDLSGAFGVISSLIPSTIPQSRGGGIGSARGMGASGPLTPDDLINSTIGIAGAIKK